MQLTLTPTLLDRLRANDPALTVLDLSHSDVVEEQAILLCQVLTQKTVLASLNLGSNNIGAAGIATLTANLTLLTVEVADNAASQAQIEKLFLPTAHGLWYSNYLAQ